MSVHNLNKEGLAPFREAFLTGDPKAKQRAFFNLFAPDAIIRFAHPFDQVTGLEALWDQVYAPLIAAMPDMERRDFIVMAGPRWGDGRSGDWVGLGGNIVGTLTRDWLGIPPHDHPVFMRYHEYLRIKNGKIAEYEGLWDIPQIMKQVGVWPMGGQAGADWMCPGPADGMGVITSQHDPAKSNAAVQLVWDMLHDLKQGDATTPERGLGGYWAEHAYWHGPTGLGTARGHIDIAQRIFKQFRDGLSQNTRNLEDGVFFGDDNLVAFTGWPSGTAIHSGNGFLNLSPTGRKITRRSLDFWRIDRGLIQECWVMIDMLDLYRQLGIDIFARMAALTGQNLKETA
ncbi:MAG: ester cyclase [Pseudomonadota bacterium]